MGIEYKKDKIVGKAVTGVSWSQGDTTLMLTTSDGVLRFDIGAGCCSESWIEHVTVPKLPAKIIDVKERNLPDPPASGRQECDVAYSAVFVTDQGELEVEFRNSSNGYYGGDITLCE